MFSTIAPSIVSGIFGSLQQSQFLQDQQEQNQHIFEQNMALARTQNQYNIDQWNRANEYNLPINQIKRLKEAGLSPTLMYKNGTSLSAAPSPTLTAGTPKSPVDMTLGGRRSTIGDIFNQTLQNALTSAQARKDLAGAKGQEITNETLMQQNITTIEKMLSEIGVNNESITQIKANVESIYKQFDVWTAQIDKIRNDITNDNERLALQRLETEIKDKLATQEIKESASRIGLNEKQLESITKRLPLELVNLAKQGDLTQAQINESVSRWMINTLTQEKVIAETDKITLENMILRPDALKSDYKARDLDRKIGNWEFAKDLSNATDELYRFLELIAKIIPG